MHQGRPAAADTKTAQVVGRYCTDLGQQMGMAAPAIGPHPGGTFAAAGAKFQCAAATTAAMPGLSLKLLLGSCSLNLR